ETERFKAQVAEHSDDIKKQEEILNKILPEAFAVVREASTHTLVLKPYQVQIMVEIAHHRDDIAEMKTDEGKKLTATRPVHINELTGRGVHVIKVNEYLSSVQSEEMAQLYNFLGLTVGLNLNQKNSEEKREAYNCDITYTTNNELGFDYLRDNMVAYKKDRVQKPLNYCVVDE